MYAVSLRQFVATTMNPFKWAATLRAQVTPKRISIIPIKHEPYIPPNFYKSRFWVKDLALLKSKSSLTSWQQVGVVVFEALAKSKQVSFNIDHTYC